MKFMILFYSPDASNNYPTTLNTYKLKANSC